MLCGIYPVRPLVCRTHGLPVAFRDGGGGDDEDDDGPPPGVSVSFCPKNFTAAGPADLDFGAENTLDLDALNAALTEANLRYLREQPGGPCVRRPTRVPLKQLRQQDLRVPSPPPAAA